MTVWAVDMLDQGGMAGESIPDSHGQLGCVNGPTQALAGG